MSEGRILVVEDEELIAADIVRCLQRHGHTVCGVASNGSEALEIALREHPQLALMDIHLGDGTDGIETALQLRETTGTPMIFLTGITEREIFEQAKACKPLGYLIKPFQSEQLATMVEIALENASLQQSLAASENKFRNLTENSPDIILRRDAAGRFFYYNSGAADLTNPKGVFSLTRGACEFIERNRDRPFFAYLSHFSIHTPHEARPESLDKFKRKAPGSLHGNPLYAACLYDLDASVGILLAKLAELGLEQNTMVVFTSDNGATMASLTSSQRWGCQRGAWSLSTTKARMPSTVSLLAPLRCK
jgi:CheY-like chemotaxis protein